MSIGDKPAFPTPETTGAYDQPIGGSDGMTIRLFIYALLVGSGERHENAYLFSCRACDYWDSVENKGKEDE